MSRFESSSKPQSLFIRAISVSPEIRQGIKCLLWRAHALHGRNINYNNNDVVNSRLFGEGFSSQTSGWHVKWWNRNVSEYFKECSVAKFLHRSVLLRLPFWSYSSKFSCFDILRTLNLLCEPWEYFVSCSLTKRRNKEHIRRSFQSERVKLFICSEISLNCLESGAKKYLLPD